MKYTSDFGRAIDSDIFFAFHHKVIEELLARGASVLVATPKEEPTVILGFLVHEALPAVDGPIVHFGYVKSAFRRLGIFRRLLEAAGVAGDDVYFTAPTDTAFKIAKKSGATFNPFLM